MFIFAGFLMTTLTSMGSISKPIRILVITGGHDYKKEQFNQMLESFSLGITYRVAELPGAFNMFVPENRNQYDVLVFYHMWQNITDEQAKVFSECIKQGKPVVALHHSICAFDDWPEYWNILGGKYFHRPTTFKGHDYPAGTYKHDLHFRINIVDPDQPVTRDVHDFEIRVRELLDFCLSQYRLLTVKMTSVIFNINDTCHFVKKDLKIYTKRMRLRNVFIVK